MYIYVKLMFCSYLIELLSLLFLCTAADDKFPKKEKDGGENENEEGDDIKEEVFVPGQLHCRTFHPGVVRVPQQVLQPPHRPEIQS